MEAALKSSQQIQLGHTLTCRYKCCCLKMCYRFSWSWVALPWGSIANSLNSSGITLVYIVLDKTAIGIRVQDPFARCSLFFQAL